MQSGDGCTFWLQGWGEASWRHCCDLHDFAYGNGADKVTADLELALCVAQTGHSAMALLMLIGVTLFGWAFFRRVRKS